MPNTMNSVELDGVTFNVADLCTITKGAIDEFDLFSSNRMRIDKIYSNYLGDIEMSLFDDRFKKPYGSVTVYTPIPRPYRVITKLKKLNINR